MSQGAGTRDGVELYYRPGGFVGYETDAAAWTLAGSASGFDPVSAISCPIPVTPLPITFNVCIPAGERYGFTSPARAVPVPLDCTIRSRPGPCSRTMVRCVCTSARRLCFRAFTGFVTQNKLMQGYDPVFLRLLDRTAASIGCIERALVPFHRDARIPA